MKPVGPACSIGSGQVLTPAEKHAAKCRRCLKNPRVCYCASIVPIETRCRILILQHPSEMWRPSATAKIADLALPNARLYIKEDESDERELESVLSDPGVRTFIVLPHEAVPEPAELRASGALDGSFVPAFLFLDGSWRQVRRMRHRRKWLEGLPAVTLRPQHDSMYRIRRQAQPGHLSTLEAVALLLSQVEDRPERFGHLLDLLDLMVTRILALRGMDRDGVPLKTGTRWGDRGVVSSE